MRKTLYASGATYIYVCNISLTTMTQFVFCILLYGNFLPSISLFFDIRRYFYVAVFFRGRGDDNVVTIILFTWKFLGLGLHSRIFVACVVINVYLSFNSFWAIILTYQIAWPFPPQFELTTLLLAACFDLCSDLTTLLNAACLDLYPELNNLLSAATPVRTWLLCGLQSCELSPCHIIPIHVRALLGNWQFAAQIGLQPISTFRSSSENKLLFTSRPQMSTCHLPGGTITGRVI